MVPKQPPDDTVLERRVAFGQRLREARERAGLTQTAVAARAGMDRSFYADVEAARHSVSIDKVFAIADVIGIHAAELFSGLSTTGE